MIRIRVRGDEELAESLRRKAANIPRGRVIVGSAVPYAPYVEYGTATRGEPPYASGSPYTIEPVRKKALAFPSLGEGEQGVLGWRGGKRVTKVAVPRLGRGQKGWKVRSDVVFVKRVAEHPGIRPHPYMRPAARETPEIVRGMVESKPLTEWGPYEFLDEIGRQVSDVAKELVPYRTGSLRRSIMWRVE